MERSEMGIAASARPYLCPGRSRRPCVSALVVAAFGPSLASLRATRASDGERESAWEADTRALRSSRPRNEADAAISRRELRRGRHTPMRLTLLVRAYCHLCDDMRAALKPLADAAGATITEIDVDADPAIEQRFGDLVPVLLLGTLDGVELCHYHLDRARVASALRAGATPVA